MRLATETRRVAVTPCHLYRLGGTCQRNASLLRYQRLLGTAVSGVLSAWRPSLTATPALTQTRSKLERSVREQT